MSFNQCYALECARLAFPSEVETSIGQVRDFICREIQTAVTKDGKVRLAEAVPGVVIPIGSTVRQTYYFPDPDFDYIILASDLPSIKTMHHLMSMILEGLIARTNDNPLGNMGAGDVLGEMVNVERIGLVSLVAELRVHEEGDVRDPLRTDIQITAQKSLINVRYEESFRKTIAAMPEPRRRDVILSIRLLKKIARANGIYGVANQGLVGNLVEQIMLQYRSDEVSRVLDPVMRVLRDHEKMPIRHPGFISNSNMWTMLDRYGLMRRLEIERKLSWIARRYLELAASDSAWTVGDLVAPGNRRSEAGK